MNCKGQSVLGFRCVCLDQSYTTDAIVTLLTKRRRTNACVCFQVRWEALQALCSAPPSDVLSCENWSSLQKHLSAALADPDLSVSPDTLTCLLLSQYVDAHSIINYPMTN